MARRTGRPSGLTDEVRANLLHAFRLGATVRIACGATGVSEAAFYRWMAKGEAAKTGSFREFRDEVQRARDRGDLELLAFVRKGARDDPRLALDLLARRHPEAYARKDRHVVKHTGHDGGPITVAAVVANLADMSPDQLRAMLAVDEAPPADVIDAAPTPLLKEVS